MLVLLLMLLLLLRFLLLLWCQCLRIFFSVQNGGQGEVLTLERRKREGLTLPTSDERGCAWGSRHAIKIGHACACASGWTRFLSCIRWNSASLAWSAALARASRFSAPDAATVRVAYGMTACIYADLDAGLYRGAPAEKIALPRSSTPTFRLSPVVCDCCCKHGVRPTKLIDAVGQGTCHAAEGRSKAAPL